MASIKRFYQLCAAFLGLIQLSTCADLRIYCNDDTTLQDYQEVPLSVGQTLLSRGCYNRARKNFFFIFGFTGVPTGSAVTTVNSAAVGLGTYNVWLLNWQREASAIFNSSNVYVKELSYPGAFLQVQNVGIQFGNKLAEMTTNGYGFTLENTYLIGHSLGAHVAAFAGRTVKASNLLIQWIIGLDPAGPIFGFAPKLALQSGDAKMVTIIHTDMGDYGINTTQGDVNILPNYGNFLEPDTSAHVQTGCPIGDFEKLSPEDLCSHNRSYALFAEGIKNTDPSTSLVAAWAESYSDWWDGSGDCSDTVTIGLQLDLTKRGLYFLDTNGAPVYGEGPDGALCT